MDPKKKAAIDFGEGVRELAALQDVLIKLLQSLCSEILIGRLDATFFAEKVGFDCRFSKGPSEHQLFDSFQPHHDDQYILATLEHLKFPTTLRKKIERNSFKIKITNLVSTERTRIYSWLFTATIVEDSENNYTNWTIIGICDAQRRCGYFRFLDWSH